MRETRIIEQLDTMVGAGRITAEEADRLRATAGTAEFGAILGAVRARHAQVHTDAAVAAGRMSPEEAAASLDRVRDGEHSAELRAHIKGTKEERPSEGAG
jgi:polyhydroxyalkanoate synthesis regulator phasin